MPVVLRFASAPSTCAASSRYSPELVKAFSTIRSGRSLRRTRARRLHPAPAGIRLLCQCVQASIVPDPEQADNATVTLSVIEAPPKRLEFGLGYSTDTQWKASGNYSDVNIDGHGLQFYRRCAHRDETFLGQHPLRAASSQPVVGSTLFPPASSARISKIFVTRTAAVSVGAGARSIETSTPAFGVAFYVDQQSADGRADRRLPRALRRWRIHMAARRQPAHSQSAGT